MWIQAPWKSFKLFIYWCVNEIYEHFTKISYCFRVPGWQDMKRKWRLLVMMFNVTPKKGVVDIDDIKSRGAEVSWRKKQNETHFSRDSSGTTEPADFARMSHISPGSIWWSSNNNVTHGMVWWLNSQFEIGCGPQKDRLFFAVCPSGKIA